MTRDEVIATIGMDALSRWGDKTIADMNQIELIKALLQTNNELKKKTKTPTDRFRLTEEVKICNHCGSGCVTRHYYEL